MEFAVSSIGKSNNSSPSSMQFPRNGNMWLCLAREVVRQKLLFSGCALVTRTLIWFGHGCSRHRARWEHELYYGLGMDALKSVGNAEHERDSGLGMDALESVVVVEAR